MSNKHFHICDECGHMEESVERIYTYTFNKIYNAPKKWMTVNGADVCSKKCAKNYTLKLKDVVEATVHCCCKEGK